MIIPASTLALVAAVWAIAACPAQQVPAGSSSNAASCPQKLVSPDLAEGDIFGAAVAVEGDILLVAAEYDDDNGTDSGSVWVYRRQDGRWIHEQKLKPRDGQAGDNFGRSVAISGSVAVIGAHWDDDKGSQAGSVYVFRHDGEHWAQEQKIVAPDGAANARFGVTVAVSGDRLVVGAWLDDARARDSGSAYVFHHDGTSWHLEQKLRASDGKANDHFGRSVSLSGDVALVGAWHADPGGANSGSAYVFRRNGESWTEQATLVPSGLGPGDLFGWTTALDGEVAVVGCYRDDEAGEDAGAAYVFRQVEGHWTLEQKLVATDAAAFNQFGYAVALEDDLLLVGAKIAEGSEDEVGKAYVFRRPDSTWTQERVLQPPDGEVFGAFGFHLDGSGDWCVVGAWRHEAAGRWSGAAYAWKIPLHE